MGGTSQTNGSGGTLLSLWVGMRMNFFQNLYAALALVGNG
jgi:hypothetical protein